jgi:hypothetical protein
LTKCRRQKRLPLPDRLRVGGLTYRVEQVKRLEDWTGEGDLVLGEVEHSQATIRIRRDSDPDVALTVLLHEALHAILVQAYCHDECSERAVTALGYGIAGLLRDNRDFAEGLVWGATQTLDLDFGDAGDAGDAREEVLEA